jgi:uncharacterized membrane protein (GlpM family)
VKVAAVRTRVVDTLAPRKNTTIIGGKYVEIVAAFQTQYYISGIAPYGDSLVVLAYLPVTEKESMDVSNGVQLKQVIDNIIVHYTNSYHVARHDAKLIHYILLMENLVSLLKYDVQNGCYNCDRCDVPWTLKLA